VFDDVSSETVWADWIEEIASIGYVWGCGGGHFCPEGSILRKELAVFLLHTLEGTDYTPPPAEGFFDDVPGDLYMPWIDELARRGIATTCGGNNFCPDDVVTRSQMAVFVVRAFDLPIFIE
jgi:hypothetical protein